MPKKTALLCSTRLNLALISFLGTVMFYALRSNLSFAIVCMVKPLNDLTTLSSSFGLSHESNATIVKQCNETSTLLSSFISTSTEPKLIGEFEWSKATQGTILSAFFWGYITSQVLAGYLASRIGAKLVIFGAVGLSSLMTLISPIAARMDVITFIVIRIALDWAPPMERGLLTGISYAGAQIGNVVVMPLSGYLCHYGFDGGWPSIFYFLGLAGFAWCILWLAYAADTPQKDKKITELEREYILESLGEPSTKKSNSVPPFRAIFTSPAVWACFVGHFAGDWGAYTLATCLPMFLNDVLALGGQALFLNLIGYCGCGQELLVIVLLIFGIGISGLQYSGFVVNYLDIGPAYAGTIVGIGNTLSCFAGILSPIFTGWLTPTGSKSEWQHVFWLTGAILVFGAVFFAIFAKGDVQKWAHSNEDREERRLGQANLPTSVEPLLTESKEK